MLLVARRSQRLFEVMIAACPAAKARLVISFFHLLLPVAQHQQDSSARSSARTAHWQSRASTTVGTPRRFGACASHPPARTGARVAGEERQVPCARARSSQARRFALRARRALL